MTMSAQQDSIASRLSEGGARPLHVLPPIPCGISHTVGAEKLLADSEQTVAFNMIIIDKMCI